MKKKDNLTISLRAKSASALEEFAQKVADSAARLPQIEEGTPEQIRAWRKERGNPFAPLPKVMRKTEDLFFPLSRGRVKVRHYIPENAKHDRAACCIYFHGGGFVLGDVDEYDTLTQHLAANSGCHVMSVDYELAPASKIKQIHQDGLEVYQWVREHGTELGIDPHRVALAGDSAGGNLTVAVTLACKKANIPQPRFQVLIYPSVNPAVEFQSVKEFAEGYFLTKAGMDWFRSHYLESPDQALEYELSFLRQDLAGLAPALVITAGFDPLRDEGQAYADKLKESGVRVEHVCYTDQIHAFLSFAGGIKAGDDALRRIGAALQQELA
ncbi:MAG TPA: alpha/beta hydrolase [Gammaproteobacteria bacterium]|nr:alpha/beta hydrolase [Gammaproteobacteria bacterium]|tara:strand:+ start:1158 stop:2135 length:978 start_codon:yes stop_codon:yes gene_type:complete